MVCFLKERYKIEQKEEKRAFFLKPLLLTGENNLINRLVFAGFYWSEIVFQPDRSNRTGYKSGRVSP